MQSRAIASSKKMILRLAHCKVLGYSELAREVLLRTSAWVGLSGNELDSRWSGNKQAANRRVVRSGRFRDRICQIRDDGAQSKRLIAVDAGNRGRPDSKPKPLHK